MAALTAWSCVWPAGHSPTIEGEGANTGVFAGAAALDAQVARVAAKAGVAGLEFYAGIPGTVGGALTMNAGCYGSETKDVLVEAYAFDRSPGETHHPLQRRDDVLLPSPPKPGPGRRCSMASSSPAPCSSAAQTTRRRSRRAWPRSRRAARPRQPIREKTGGSTFRKPPGHSAWKLVDDAGWRRKPFGGAMFSPLHANLMINTGEATAADLEGLGEAVRADVAAEARRDARLGDQANRPPGLRP